MLIRACQYQFSQNLKAMAITQGSENIDLNEDWYSTRDTVPQKVMRMHDLPAAAATGLSLGYETTAQ